MGLCNLSDPVVALLQKRGRLAYRVLKLQFQLDEEQLAARKEELLFCTPVGGGGRRPRSRMAREDGSELRPACYSGSPSTPTICP